MNSVMWLAYSMIWLSTAAVATAGAYFTHSASCLLVMILPVFMKSNLEHHVDDDLDDDEDQ